MQTSLIRPPVFKLYIAHIHCTNKSLYIFLMYEPFYFAFKHLSTLYMYIAHLMLARCIVIEPVRLHSSSYCAIGLKRHIVRKMICKLECQRQYRKYGCAGSTNLGFGRTRIQQKVRSSCNVISNVLLVTVN